jgi:hypothetical protein
VVGAVREAEYFSPGRPIGNGPSTVEAAMLPFEQLIAGIAIGLAFCALLRWTPLARDLLAATAAAGLVHFLISEKSQRPSAPAFATKLPHEILTHPHFCLGLLLAAAGVLALLHLSRLR